jgi:chromate transporter
MVIIGGKFTPESGNGETRENRAAAFSSGLPSRTFVFWPISGLWYSRAMMIERPRPRLWELFRTWLSIGLQSFGGGSPTFYLIHQACITRNWLDEAEFVRAWALVQISPGVNLIKLTMLIGYKLRGWRGLVAAVAGLVVPTALATVLMTAGFSLVKDQPVVKAAMRGIIPATLGLSLAVAWQMAQPLLVRARREGPTHLSTHIALLVGSALLMAVAGVSPVVVLLVAGALAAVGLTLLSRRDAAHADTARTDAVRRDAARPNMPEGKRP